MLLELEAYVGDQRFIVLFVDFFDISLPGEETLAMERDLIKDRGSPLQQLIPESSAPLIRSHFTEEETSYSEKLVCSKETDTKGLKRKTQGPVTNLGSQKRWQES